MRLVAAAAVLLAAAGTVPAAVQEPATAPIRLRLVVSDARGRPVTGLSPPELEITQGAEQRKIEALAHVARAPRTIGILFDDYHVSEGEASARARQALLGFITRDVRPDDTLFVMRPIEQASPITPAVSGEQLRQSIASFVGRKGNYTPRTDFEAEYMSVVPPAAARQRAQVARAAMQALVAAIRTAAVQRRPQSIETPPMAMVVVTEGFPDERRRERFASLQTIARAAGMADVAVYVIDPSPGPAGSSLLGAQWRAFATDTGGLVSLAGAPLEPAFMRVAADLDAHYVATIPGAAVEDGAFHALEVKVKRAGVTVRAPAGFWAPIAAERYTVPTRPAMSTYLKTPHASGAIQPWFRMARGERGRTVVTFSWVPRQPRASGARVAMSAVTFEGDRLHEADVVAQGSAEGDRRAAFTAPPGPIQVAMSIVDASGRVIDTDVRYLDVPSLDTAGATITAVELVRTRTRPEFLRRQVDADAMPVDSRDFHRQDRLIVRVRTASPETAVRARLLNSLGGSMKELAALPPVDGVPQFDLPLAPYARGDYRIEITADAGGSPATQLVSFRLIG